MARRLARMVGKTVTIKFLRQDRRPRDVVLRGVYDDGMEVEYGPGIRAFVFFVAIEEVMPK